MSLFCEHKKLRTTCPDCRQAAQAEVSTQRADQPLRAVDSGRSSSKPTTPGRASAAEARTAKGGDEGEAKEGRKKSGPMLPKRVRQRTPSTRAEADKAEAWWVKK